jgi:hypothetical protein
VKSTKGFGNFAIPKSGSPGVLGHGEQLWKKKKKYGVIVVICTYKKKKKKKSAPERIVVSWQLRSEVINWRHGSG